MPLDFPNTPNVGDTYTGGSGTWRWDGTKWVSGTSASMYLPLTGGSLSGPGNLSVGGTLNVTGNSTVNVLTGSHLVSNGEVTAQGGTCGLQFYDRGGGGGYWEWYSTGNVARLWLNTGGDFLTIDTGGSLSVHGSLTAGATIKTNGSRVIAAGPATQPSLCMWDTSLGVAGGLYSEINTGRIGFATMDGGGNPSAGLAWVDRSGNITAGAGVIIGNSNLVFNTLGQTMYPPGDGWLYFNGSFRVWDFQSSNNVNAAGSVYVGGLSWFNWGGWMRSNSGIYSGGTMQADGDVNAGGVLRCGGNPYWQNNANWMYCPFYVLMGGILQVNGGGDCIVCYNGNIVTKQELSCMGRGVEYGNLGSNGFNARWDGNYIYWRVDNAVEFAMATVSDERLKTDIAPSRFDSLALVKQLPLHEFRWRDLGTKPARHKEFLAGRITQGPAAKAGGELVPVGFITQELAKVFPAGVMPGTSAGVGHAPPEWAPTMGATNDPVMLAVLTGAIQQLLARVEALEGKIA